MMNRETFVLATRKGGALIALLLLSGGALAQSAVNPSPNTMRNVSNAPAGASACLGCHGAGQTEMPSLEKLSAADIETAMEQYRSGTREATLMNRIAKGFTPEESRAIALWLSEKEAVKR
jgi:sulfide dehydrogenase cytochrome subunit